MCDLFAYVNKAFYDLRNASMDSDESTTSKDYPDAERSQHSSPRYALDEEELEELEDVKLNERRRMLLEKLPSPREFMTTPDNLDFTPVPSQKLTSISDLNPFFDELDISTSEYTTETETELCPSKESVNIRDSVQNATVESSRSRHGENNPVCRRTYSFRKIWSSLGSSNLPGLPIAAASTSQESACSSSESKADGDKELTSKQTLKHRLKRVSNRVRKQISNTGCFITDRFARNVGAKSESNLAKIQEEEGGGVEETECPKCDSRKVKEFNEVGVVDIDAHDSKYTESKESIHNIKHNSVPVAVTEVEPTKLLWCIPNWTENHVIEDHGASTLEAQMNKEKEILATNHPLEWKESSEYLKKSVGRDFRRGFLAMGEKMKLPNFDSVRYLKFSQFHNHSFLAIGGEDGALIVLELDYQKPLVQSLTRSDERNQNLFYHAPIRSKCRIQMNETLEGHAYDLKCLAWNNARSKLLTSDEAGVIIGWSLTDEGYWVEEIINDRSTSRICDMAWSPNGEKVVIGYEDFAMSGALTGGIIVGLANGTHVYDRKFPDQQVHAVVWYDDFIVWAIIGYSLYSIDANGEIGNNFRPIEMLGAPTEFIEFLLRPKSSWISAENSPDFIVVCKESCVALFNSFLDKTPTRIHTQLTTTCADWSSNGVYFVVGGYPTSESVHSDPQIHLYNYEGKLLQILKVPDSQVSSISWTHDSLHIAFSTVRHIYFANLRPIYKISSSNTVHCYAHVNNRSHQWLTFWSGKMVFRESIPGKVIDIKNYEDKFSVLTMDSSGIYHVFIFGISAVKQQHLCVTTMEPFALAMTKNSVMCLAPNAILNWNYNLFTVDGSKKYTGALKATRQVHVDDFPGIIVKPGEKQDHLQKPTTDCARCFHAIRDRLCVARESGKLQMYALPTLGFLQTYRLDLQGDICQEIQFNNDGTQLALLTMNGNMRICRFPEARERRKDASYTGQQIQLLLCEGLTTVTSLLWASDLSHYISVLEGNNIHFLHDDQIIETIANIPTGCYLVDYKGLRATLLCMDALVQNPDNPNNDVVLKLSSPSLTRLESAIEQGDCLEDILTCLQSSHYSHHLLRQIVGEEALRRGDTKLVESIFTQDRNYQGLCFLEKLKETDFELQRAHAHSFLMEYDQAQHYFIRAGRKDLAIKMWKDLGDWEKVSFLSSFHSEDITKDALECQYRAFHEDEDWEMAFSIAMKLEDPEKLIDICIASEDYKKLIPIVEKLPPKDPLLLKAGKLLSGLGLIEEATFCLSQFGRPDMAMAVAVDTRHWELAMKLSKLHKLPLIKQALVKHVKSLIAADQLNSAVQVLDRCGKILTAAKLLIWKGLRLLQEESSNTMEIKKIFVLAAMMLGKKKAKVDTKKGAIPSPDTLEELDLEFLITKDQLEIMVGHNEWCWSNPWRGAEAVHYLNLTQRFIYRGMMGRAFKAAAHLKNFEDIIGFERTNSLLALTAISNGYLNVASNALLKLEAYDDEFHQISFNLFMEHAPKDHDVCYVVCPGCAEEIPDFYSICPICNLQFLVCIYSASNIPAGVDIWTCETCRKSVELSKKSRFDCCLLCHSSS